MSFNDIPDTLTEPRFSLARQIEYLVTNGLGYNTKTDFNSHLYSSEEVKNTEKGLKAHLAHLEMNTAIPKIRSTYYYLENLPEDFEFSINKPRFFGLLGRKKVVEKLNQKERDTLKRRLEKEAKYHKKTFELYKEDAEYPTLNDKFNKHIFYDLLGCSALEAFMASQLREQEE